MAPWVDIPLAVESGEALAPYASDAELVNLMLVPNPKGARRPFHIAHTPAMYGALGTDVIENLNGTAYRDGQVYAIRGDKVIRTNGSSVTILGGALSGGAPTRPLHLVNAGDCIVAVGATELSAYKFTSSAITTITPPGGITFRAVAYMDGYTIYARDGSDEFYVSSLDDPTTIGALDFSTADANPGSIVALAVANRELVILKDRSMELWYNAGAADFPFVRSSPGVIERGCIGPGAVAKYENQLFFVGDNWSVYALNGYTPVKISTPEAERLLEAMSANPDQSLYASTYTCDGRAYLQLQDSRTDTYQLVYDIETRLWHKRQSSNITKVQGVTNLLTGGSDFYTIAYAATTSRTGFYLMSGAGQYNDAGASGQQTRTITLPAIDGGGRRVFMSELYLDMEKHSAAGNVSLTYSDDGGSTYSSAKTRDGTVARVRWGALGSFYQRILRFSFSVNSRIAVMGVRAKLEYGA